MRESLLSKDVVNPTILRAESAEISWEANGLKHELLVLQRPK
jgi:hypothetical protein